MNVHDNEHRADDDALHAAAEDRVRDNGERLVDDHVRKQEGDEQEVSVLADGLDLVGIPLLVSGTQNAVSSAVDHTAPPQEARRLPTGADLRRSTDAEHVQLRLVQAHVSECQTGKQTRQEDKYGDEACEDDEYDPLAGVLGGARPTDERVRAGVGSGEATGRQWIMLWKSGR